LLRALWYSVGVGFEDWVGFGFVDVEIEFSLQVGFQRCGSFFPILYVMV
jgi:hypothetical protein